MPDTNGVALAPHEDPITREVSDVFDALKRRKPSVPEVEIFRGALGKEYLIQLNTFLKDVRTCPPDVLSYARQRLAMPEWSGGVRPALAPDPVVVEERRLRATLPRMGFTPWGGKHFFDPVESS